MAERKAIPKKIRFEVFKRDKFTCQYCGRSAPDVILEIDHLNPVAEGGDNDILNLITSCRDCNRGKGKKKLSDNSVISKQKAQLAELSDKRDQLKMMIEWREELREISKKETEAICDEFNALTGLEMTEDYYSVVESWLKQFSFTEILEAMDIAVDKYFENTGRSACSAFSKISGICYNRRYQSDKDYQFNYLRKCCIHNFNYCDERILRKIVDRIEEPMDFKYIVDDLKHRSSWTDFKLGNYEDLEEDFYE